MEKKKRLYDAVYGYIELEENEFKLINSPIFQRLHWIKQLGPLNTVFPSAQHSRFSHSVGVFHIITKIIKAIEERPDDYRYKYQDNEKKYLRYAALLHDIGHIPLSHIGEKALGSTYAPSPELKTEIKLSKGTKPKWTNLFPDNLIGPKPQLHELLSAEVVLNSGEIDTILTNEWPDENVRKKAKRKIAEIIVGTCQQEELSLLLHSELDADRLDYLLRDSFFTGVGYGHVDLDYIISRISVITNDDTNIPSLCFESKGLHTVEHCILGRFFLQTQVIFNRNVHLLDLLFLDVMVYMIENETEKCGLINLEKVLDHIRKSKGKNKREHQHEFYKYTDAQVFVNMRMLHEKLDNELKNLSKKEYSKNPKAYINDCIKTIMDGQIPETLAFHQKMLDSKTDSEEVNKISEKAREIALKTAEKLKIDLKRIKWDLIEQKVMQYRSDEEGNKETVKISYKQNGKEKIVYAAKSNASILSGLSDKFLLMFYVYYIDSKSSKETEVEVINKGNVIKEAYQDFILEYFQNISTDIS